MSYPASTIATVEGENITIDSDGQFVTFEVKGLFKIRRRIDPASAHVAARALEAHACAADVARMAAGVTR